MGALFIDCPPRVDGLLTAELLALVPGLDINRGKPTEAALAGLLAGREAVLVFHTPLGASLLDACPRLRVAVFLSTGASSYIDLAEAERRGILVRNTVGYGDRSVAEHAFALLLAAARDIASMDRDIRAGRWQPRPGIELAGRTLGIVGLGGTGRAMAEMAAAFGMRVIAWNRSGVPPDVPCEAAELDDLLARADAISLHLALTPETRGIIDRRRLALMRPGSILINTARGALVDEAALARGLASGTPGHAALDVFGEEPLPPDHPLAGLANVTLSAHAAYNTDEAMTRLLRLGLEALRDELAARAGA